MMEMAKRFCFEPSFVNYNKYHVIKDFIDL